MALREPGGQCYPTSSWRLFAIEENEGHRIRTWSWPSGRYVFAVSQGSAQAVRWFGVEVVLVGRSMPMP